MRYHQLFEHFVNVFDADQKRKYADQVWDIMQKSYEKVGGFGTASSADELIAKSSLWKLVVRNGHVYAAFLYKDQQGRKSVASGTDGSDMGRRDYARVKDEDIKLQRAWAEVSGPVERIMKRAGAQAVPNSLANKLTGKEILELNPDGFHYTRFIAGEPHEKIIYGFISLDANTVEQLKLQGVDLQSLPSNITLPK